MMLIPGLRFGDFAVKKQALASFFFNLVISAGVEPALSG